MNVTGVLGAGTIGQIVIEKLLKAGRTVFACDTSTQAMRQVLAAGAQAVPDASSLVDAADTIFLCLPASPQVETVVEQIAPRLGERHIIINTSSCRPSTDIRCAAMAARHGAAWVESPLTRRPEGFYFMVGASDRDYERVSPLLSIVGAKHRLLGPVGSGQVAKLMQQMLGAMEKAARLEVAAFGRRAGLDPSFLREYLGFNIPRKLLDEQTGSHATLQMMYKDLGYYLEVAHDNGASIPIGSLVHEIFKTSTRVSDGTWDHDGIHAYYRLQNVAPLEEKRSPVVKASGPLWQRGDVPQQPGQPQK
jgi:3-hydroxyisobutyrate dehydrogenase-like beta-hydroxyacid dehydrogenase